MERPLARPLDQAWKIDRPVVERFRIKIGAVGPNQRVNLGINSDLIEQRQVAEWPKQFAGEHRREVDDLLGAIAKLHAQCMAFDVLE